MNYTNINNLQVREINKQIIRTILFNKPINTKASIARESNLSITTSNTIIKELLDSNEVIELKDSKTRGGRPAAQYSYNKEHHQMLGLYVDYYDEIYRIGYTVTNATGEILKRDIIKPADITAAVIIETIENICQEYPAILGISLGIPGEINNGYIDVCDVVQLENINMKEMLEQQFDVLVQVENDMKFITHGTQMLYPEIENLSSIFFKEQNHVGSGFYINGAVHKGHSDFSGEIAYVSESFGYPIDKIYNINAFSDFAARMILTVITTVNPEKIVLYGDTIKEIKIKDLINKIREIIPERHIPSIIFNAELDEIYSQGLIGSISEELIWLL